jgi:hypothetical protein
MKVNFNFKSGKSKPINEILAKKLAEHGRGTIEGAKEFKPPRDKSLKVAKKLVKK